MTKFIYLIKKNFLIIFNLIFRSIVKHILMILLFGSSEMDVAPFNITVIADMRSYDRSDSYHTSECIRDAREAIKAGVFEIIPDDLNRLKNINWIIRKYIHLFHPYYPLLGDYQAKSVESVKWFREYINKKGNSYYPIVNTRPNRHKETIYFFQRDYSLGCRIVEINNRV
jgi:hypothetical protein